MNFVSLVLALSKSAEIFTKEDENLLWEAKVLGMESSKSLLCAVFFLNGKNLCLRGGEEHRNPRRLRIHRKFGGMAQMQVST